MRFSQLRMEKLREVLRKAGYIALGFLGRALSSLMMRLLLGGDGEVAKGQLQRSFGTWLRSLGFILKACSKPY